MALRIEYLRGGEKVMVVVFLKSSDEAVKEAQDGLKRFNADSARILDMDNGGKEVGMVKR